MSESYEDMIKSVFSNRNGHDLMDTWQKMYGDQISHIPGISTEDVAFNEGHRAFFLTIKSVLENG